MIRQSNRDQNKGKRSEDPKWRGILVKDYFPLVGSSIAVLGVAVTIGVGWVNAQNQIKAAALTAEQKALNDQFIDLQNRLSKIDNPSERINAVNSLVDIAMRPDPQFKNAADNDELALRLELPREWVGKLYVKTIIRPCEKAYPYFKPVTLRVSSVVLLDKDQAVRDAAVRACKTLSEFSRREIENLKWEEFEHLEEGDSAIPLTKYLVETLGQANRDAYTQWNREFARYIGVAQALGNVRTGSQVVLSAFYGSADWEATVNKWTEEMKSFLLPARSSPGGQTSRYWTDPSGVWQLVEALCPFVLDPYSENSQALNLAFILNGAVQPGFNNEILARRQAMSNTAATQLASEWLRQQEAIRLAAAQLMTT